MLWTLLKRQESFAMAPGWILICVIVQQVMSKNEDSAIKGANMLAGYFTLRSGAVYLIMLLS